MKAPLHIAIDGPVASGKGDIASRLAGALDLLYIYTGSMYRALALACIRAGVLCNDRKRVTEILKKISIDVTPRTILLNGEDVSAQIMKQEVAQGASDVGVFASVRRFMVKRQQEMAKGKRVVMEGRDIGLRVLPDAQLKIYLTASVAVRSHRRYLQWREKGIQKTPEETEADTKVRDLQDTTRDIDPLQKLPDSWELDTTDMDQDEVVAVIIGELKKRELI